MKDSEKDREGEVWLREGKSSKRPPPKKKHVIISNSGCRLDLKGFFTAGFQRIGGDFQAFFKVGLFQIII